MSKFKRGQKVRVSEDATYGYRRKAAVWREFLGKEVVIIDGPDGDNDYIVERADGLTAYVGAEFLTPVSVEFKRGQKVRVSKGAQRHSVYGSLTSRATFAGEEATVLSDGVDPEGDVSLMSGTDRFGWAMPQYLTVIGEPEPEPEPEPGANDFQPGDRVRVIDPGDNPVEVGDTGTVTNVVDGFMESMERALVSVNWDKGGNFGLFDHRLEKIVDEDEGPVGEVPALTGVDAVNPGYYRTGFSNNAEVIDITENLTSNGGQAVQYIARSTRLDGNNKGDVLEDLKKARWFIDREIERVENNG